jgi:thioredoxin reductase
VLESASRQSLRTVTPRANVCGYAAVGGAVTARISYLIVGAGPAGLQLGYFLDRAGLDYQIVERGDSAGAFFRWFPRHRRLLSINKLETGTEDPETNLRWDWNSLLDDGPRFTTLTERYFPSADVMVDYLQDFAARHRLRVRYNTDVLGITRAEDFVVETSRGTWTADRVIVATGLAADNVPAIPGLEHAESYRDMPTDPASFRGQRVLIIGKGNSAFETAHNLIETAAALHLVSPNPVRMAWRTRFVGDLRAVNNDLLDTYGLKLQNTVLDANVEEISRRSGGLNVRLQYTRAQGQRVELEVDRVIRCTGFRFDTSIFRELDPELAHDGRFPALTAGWESPNVPDLFFAGTLMQARDYRRTFSAFIHGFRYNVEALVHLLRERYDSVPRPWRPIALTVDAYLEALMQRMNSASSLFQQPGFLADVIRIDEGQARDFESLPIDLVRQELAAAMPRPAVILTFEYGIHNVDPFDIVRYPDDGSKTHLIHPVVRIVHRDAVTAEHHFADALDYNWSKPQYRTPLRHFLKTELSFLG